MTTRQPARPATAGWPVYERSILSSVLGLPGYAAIGIALGFTGLGVFIDLNRINGLGGIFKGCYFAGCVLAVCWVKRRALFGPMVQPPLLLAVAVPTVVLASGEDGSGGGGLTDHLLSIGAPLLNGFPTMAVATAFAVAIGLARYALQRPTGAEPTRRRTPARPPSERASVGSRSTGERGSDERARRGPGGRADRAGAERGTSERADRAGAERGTGERRAVRGAGRGAGRGVGRDAERGRAERTTADRKPPAERAVADRKPPPDRTSGDRAVADRKPPADRTPGDRAAADRKPPPDRKPGDRKPADRRPPADRLPPDRRPPPERRPSADRAPADRVPPDRRARSGRGEPPAAADRRPPPERRPNERPSAQGPRPT